MPEWPTSGDMADDMNLLLLNRKTLALTLATFYTRAFHLKLHLDGDVSLSRPWG